MRRSLISLLAGCGAAAHPVAHCDRPAVLGDRGDVAAIAACTSLPALTIRTAAPLDTSQLAVTSITGDVAIGPTVGIDTLSFPALQTIGGTLHVADNGLLQGAFFPRLARAGRIEIENNATLTTVSLPALVTAAALVIADDAALETLDVNQLATVTGELRIANVPRLAVFEHGTIAAGSTQIDPPR